ncbi:MAG: hypothetical protein ABIT92_04225 [Gammaproteobacteria bacterium]
MIKKAAWGLALLLPMLSNAAYAIDSYRYLHVSIETPWRIFLFLLIGILAPFVVMVWLYWRHARRDHDKDHHDD